MERDRKNRQQVGRLWRLLQQGLDRIMTVLGASQEELKEKRGEILMPLLSGGLIGLSLLLQTLYFTYAPYFVTHPSVTDSTPPFPTPF